MRPSGSYWESLPADESARTAQIARWIEDCERDEKLYALRLPTHDIEAGRGDTHRRRCLDALADFTAGQSGEALGKGRDTLRESRGAARSAYLAADLAADPGADSEPPPAGREQVADDPPPARSPPFAPPTSRPTAFSAPVATGVGSGVARVGSRVGLALGGLVGGLAGGAVDGFRAGLAKLRARPVTSDQPSSDQPSSASAGARNPPGDPGLRRAAREAERALADFAEAVRELDDHPRLAAFWREVDRQAAARFDGARDGVLREMASHRRHPLHLLFERHASADPNVALHHRRALDAFGWLQAAWEACALAHRDRGERWAPAPEMSDALRAACRRTPPALGQPAPIDRAEQLLRALARAIREAWSRPGGRAP